MSLDFERNRTLSKLERVGYRWLSSFLYFSIAEQGNQRHILNPNPDIFLPRFHTTGEIQTDDFGRPEFGYEFYSSIVHLGSLSFMITNWIIVWNIINCRQYCFGLLGLISAVLMSRMGVKLKKPPQMSHTCGTSKPCQSAQTSELASVRNC